MANGSILTIGGLNTATNVQQGNLEIFPKPAGGDTVVDLPWLGVTPNDLYPFVTVLQSKRLFIGGQYFSSSLTQLVLIVPLGYRLLQPSCDPRSYHIRYSYPTARYSRSRLRWYVVSSNLGNRRVCDDFSATAGRNYPLSGAFLPLPLSAPYTAPLQVFICGGTTGSGVALDNCVTIAPEGPKPTWTIERMVCTPYALRRIRLTRVSV